MRRLRRAGDDVPAGQYRCALCGYDLRVDAAHELPRCPTCGGDAYEDVADAGERRESG
jgi:predicted Zn-ribbon and HTH transcriptional regulator